MDLQPPTSYKRTSGANEPYRPHVKLADQLKHLRTCYDEAHALQTRMFDLSATAKTNTTEWTELKSASRLAVIRTRTIRTQAMKTFREVHEYLRRGIYEDDNTRETAKGLVTTASLFFDKLHRENF